MCKKPQYLYIRLLIQMVVMPNTMKKASLLYLLNEFVYHKYALILFNVNSQILKALNLLKSYLLTIMGWVCKK